MTLLDTSRLLGKKILVVEDIDDTLAGTLAELRFMGAEVDHASNVRGALIKMQAQKYNALLLDWRIPLKEQTAVNDEGAAVLLRQIETDTGNPNSETPIIIVTAQLPSIDRKTLAKYPHCRLVLSKLQADEIIEALDGIFGEGDV
jgi:CheY-like chemotaxis protein